MHFMQIESVLQIKNRSELAENWFSVALGVSLQNKLKKVQNRAARFVTGNYNFETGSMTGIFEHLKWESLKKRRRDSRLILLYKGLKGKASIPTDDLIPLVRHCRNDYSTCTSLTFFISI